MRMRTLFLVLVLMALPLKANGNALTDAIQKRYESIQHFQADFQQELTNAASGSVEKRSGKIWFKQPSLVRWDTVKPEKELLVVGQNVVWNYVEADKIALKYRTNQVFKSKTMVRFLSGKANLNEDFKVAEQGTEDGLTKVRLVPKEPEPTMVMAYIWVDPKTSLMGKVLIVDFFGNGNLVMLKNLVTDKRPDAKLFEFTPPAGLKVSDNTKQQ
ncbi:MAG: outer membrane lipoprotein chaperone LolA [Humidesulfovibrio sp.]|uniref:outer membrane lipoprotein chaperone LolA n=1 Tax=Humidesulfovibrio sp. TaxID=2910988 RepID=UPI0027F6FF9D|nr:outer membrane lipoprotein chaperone LolA [Humidesulfovibrio sp.]MDQ7834414.1 outer membrane lipoprotein chaperone LolA [Humidesulfovibrio sp.]